MKYLPVSAIAEKWGISERSVRNYCAAGRIPDAYINGKTWNIPASARKPERLNQHKKKNRTLLEILQDEKKNQMKGGIYHKIQVELTFNSNHIEGSRLTHDQTRYIYETNTLGKEEGTLDVDDIIETVNHFRCIDYMIDHANLQLNEKMIKQFHYLLKNGTSDSRKEWFAVGDYKKLPNEVGGKETAAPEDVSSLMHELITSYRKNKVKSLDGILEFHYQFEKIHPFQDGNGRVGRLIMFKECLRNDIVPFIITDELKYYYYRGLSNWNHEKGYLKDTCLSAQDQFQEYLDYFRVPYDKK